MPGDSATVICPQALSSTPRQSEFLPSHRRREGMRTLLNDGPPLANARDASRRVSAGENRHRDECGPGSGPSESRGQRSDPGRSRPIRPSADDLPPILRFRKHGPSRSSRSLVTKAKARARNWRIGPGATALTVLRHVTNRTPMDPDGATPGAAKRSDTLSFFGSSWDI